MIILEIVNGPTFQINWKGGMNVQQALELAYTNAAPGTFTYSLEYFGSTLGYLVTMVNETYETFSSKDAPYFFWEFLMNGKISPTGIDNIWLNDKDVITFEFTVYASSNPPESTTHAKFKLRTN